MVTSAGKVPSVWTVRRRLIAIQKANRLRWARQHAHWTEADWQRVLWSDETAVQLFTSRLRYVRRLSGEEYKDETIRKTVKHPGKIMMWGCFSFEVMGPVKEIIGIMDSKM